MTQPTIWNALAAKLGREPTNDEAKAEVTRILREGAEIGRRAAVDSAIRRSRPKIGKREARRIHALLAPRPWEPSHSVAVDDTATT